MIEQVPHPGADSVLPVLPPCLVFDSTSQDHLETRNNNNNNIFILIGVLHHLTKTCP